MEQIGIRISLAKKNSRKYLPVNRQENKQDLGLFLVQKGSTGLFLVQKGSTVRTNDGFSTGGLPPKYGNMGYDVTI